MAKSPFKNLIFLIRKRLSASTPTITASSFASASPPLPSTVDSYRLPLKSAIAASQKIQLNNKSVQRHDSVLNLLKSHGFDHTHIAAIMEKFPILVHYKVDDNLKPKLDYLVENGFSGPHLHHLIVNVPSVLGRSLNAHIKPSFEFLRSLLGAEDRVSLALKRNPWLLTNGLKGTLQSNVDLLLKEGLALDAITKFFMSQPNKLQPRSDRLVFALKTVKDRVGMDPSAPMFLAAVTTISSMGASLWEKKVQVLKSFGFSGEEVLEIFRRCPNCLSRSEETLRAKMEFYLDTVKLELGDVVSYPILLSLAMDARSRPRHNVLKVLLSKQLLMEDVRLAYLLTISEERFLKKYVMGHLQQVPNLLEMYCNDKVKKKVGI